MRFRTAKRLLFFDFVSESIERLIVALLNLVERLITTLRELDMLAVSRCKLVSEILRKIVIAVQLFERLLLKIQL